MGVEIAQWRLFLAVADTGSFSRAAVRLGLDQPAVSRAARRLELSAGTSLFVRTAAGTSLTSAGQRLLEPARRLVADAEALDARASVLGRSPTTTLRVGVLDVQPFTAALARARSASRRLDPPVHVELVDLPWLAHTRAVLDRTIDVGITLTIEHRLPVPHLLRSEPLCTATRAYALLPAEHPLAAVDTIDPQALAGEPLYMPLREHTPEIHDLILETLDAGGLAAPRIAPPAESFAAVLQHVAAGEGWIVVTDLVAAHPVAGTVARPLAAAVPPAVQLEVVWHRDAESPALQAYVDQLLGHNPFPL
jgi:DNA-binding transcriptional LysR family regulator